MQIQRRLLSKKDLTFETALEEAVGQETAARNVQTLQLHSRSLSAAEENVSGADREATQLLNAVSGQLNVTSVGGLDTSDHNAARNSRGQLCITTNRVRSRVYRRLIAHNRSSRRIANTRSTACLL